MLAEVSSNSFLLAFSSSSLDFSFFFTSMNLSHVLSNLRLLVGELRNVARFLALLVFGTRYSDRLSPTWTGDFFSCKRIQIWFGDLLVAAVLTLFNASLLFTLRCSYRKIMFKTGLLWPLDFRVDSEGKWRSSARYSTDHRQTTLSVRGLIWRIYESYE